MNDIPWSSYIFDIWNKNITLVDVPFVVTKWNIFAIINATRNIIMYKVDTAGELPISWNIIDLASYDLSAMDTSDELIIIMDLPIQKTETNDENWNLIAWQQLTKQQESNAILQEVQDLNDTILELTMRLWFLPAVRWQLNDLRVSVLNAVAVTISSWTVTTVSSVTNIASIWWYNMNAMLWALQNNLVANAITNNIIL